MIISPCVYKLLLLYYPWTEHFNVFSVLSGPFPCLGSHGGNSGRTRYTRRTFDSIQCDDYHSDLSSCLCTYDMSIFFQILMVWQIFINKAPKLNAILLMKNFTHIDITWNYLNWSWNTCLFSQDYNTLLGEVLQSQ